MHLEDAVVGLRRRVITWRTAAAPAALPDCRVRRARRWIGFLLGRLRILGILV